MRFSDANSVQRFFFRALLDEGQCSAPREMKTRELVNQSFELTNPRNRLTTLAGRGWSRRLAIGELAWHLRGDRDANSLAHYVPRWAEFADSDGLIRGSCYGWTVFTADEKGGSQWELVAELLQADSATRRAVLNFQGPEFQRRSLDSPDVSCAVTQQFLIRGNRLHSILNMRSNDAFWGLPYDLFVFTSLQELMATYLNLELGSYFHNAGSLHLYDDMVGRAEKLLAFESSNMSEEMAPMNSLQGMKYFLDVERSIRANESTELIPQFDNTFWGQCADALKPE